MTTYTPGPWKAAPSYRGGDYIETDGLNEEGELRLITCPGNGGAVSYSQKVCQLQWSGTPEWAANAALIAAAPDLLKACTAAMNALRSYQYSNASPELAEEIADSVEEAIAKARGEQS